MRVSGLTLVHVARRRQARRAVKEGGVAWVRLSDAAGVSGPPTPAAPPPLDAEPPMDAATRLFGRKPDGMWRYAMANDQTAFYAVRWDEPDGGRKKVRPLSWGAPEGWRFAAWPARAPLYNLPDVFRRPTAAVVVCEGEKAADAATSIFPDHMATTSSNGAAAVFKTDWTPLAGRAVLIWPDLDAIGQTYAREVATTLAALGCAVSIIDARALAAIDPSGGRRAPKAKWDAADAAADWPDLGALANAAANWARPFGLARPAPVDRAAALNNRANALRDGKRPRDALACYDAAIAIRPDFAEAFSNRGNALLELKRPSEALASYEKALAIDPRFADALSNRGVALRDLGRFDEALRSVEAALVLRPDHVDALNNRGLLLHNLGRPADALASYDRALALRPQFADAGFNRALTALSMGDFSSGWRGYEFRWDRANAAARRLRAPYPGWRGEDIAGKRLIVYEEQGLGDIIQFSPLLRRLVALGADVTFLVRASLHRLLSVANPSVRLVAGPPQGEAFDCQCALMSLPGVLAISLDGIPSDVPYLRAEPGAVARWRQRLGARGLKIGVCWQGNPHSLVDVGRSFPLMLLEGVAAIPGVRLISLQQAYGLDQLERFPAGMEVETLGPAFDGDRGAFVETAAVMACLDLVITCDTSVAHLAGALGRPVWVALQRAADWRWMLDRADSPWYPTMTLYRQTVRGEWDAVFERMAADVLQLAVRPAAPPAEA